MTNLRERILRNDDNEGRKKMGSSIRAWALFSDANPLLEIRNGSASIPQSPLDSIPGLLPEWFHGDTSPRCHHHSAVRYRRRFASISLASVCTALEAAFHGIGTID